MTQKENKNKEKGRIKAFFTKRNTIFTVIGVLFLIQYIQLQSVLGTFSFLEGRDSSLVTEIGEIKEAYISFGEDLNEIREFLRMPTKNYMNFGEIEGLENEDGSKNTNQVQLALFQYVDYLNKTKKVEQDVKKYQGFLSDLTNSEEFANFLGDNNLTLSALQETPESVTLSVNNANDELIFFYLSKEDGSLFLKTILKKETVGSENSEAFIKEMETFINANKSVLENNLEKLKKMKEEIAAAISASDTQKALAELEITLATQPTEQDLKLSYAIYNKTNEIIAEILLDQPNLELWLVDKKDSSLSLQVTDINKGLVPFLKKLDTKTFVEKKAQEALVQLKETLADEGFKLLLDQTGFTVSEQPREDDERIYYDILNAGGELVSSLVVEKTTGVINIVDANGTNAENLLFFDPEFKKKTLEIPDVIPEYGDELSHDDSTFNILIAGKHGSLVDTMIFTHIDEERGDIRMISIPRDLFYNGRKINSFPHYYGMEELKKVLSDITGYELDKFILIDMYAFIDVIDLIGGIDIHLDQAVIDPTYKTIDNGVEGTLHYEPGDYHLGGKEALRLARTRHTSSDFARAERQQMILEALQDKARNFGFGDADTIYEIAKVVLSKTETDITLDEAIAYYFRYQNYEIKSNNVMSSGNVLYVPPYITAENCSKLIAEAEAAGQPRPNCENENQAYTLLPRDNNWNVIKWFFRENFEGV